MDTTLTAVLSLIVLAASFAATRVALPLLAERQILDHPNERSSHTQPTPRGAGLAVIPVLIVAWWVVANISEPIAVSAPMASVLAASAGLAFLSWIDDLKGLKPSTRLSGQFATVSLVIIVAPESFGVLQGWVSPGLGLIVAGFLWVWFLNLYNFMDGIDGITGAETIAIGVGVAVVAEVAGLTTPLAAHGLTAAAAALGFLWWNRPPARVFLGDVGSVPLGFLMGWLLFTLAAEGYWASALILPLYYVADATVTLVDRLTRLEPVFTAHREHAYQRAVQHGMSHGAVVAAITGVNVALIALAAAAARWPQWGWAWLLAAAAVVALLLQRFIVRPRRPR
jgi:UDP-N-acetylmuramyl pentapeptide phosphotransferase/UDP-N-acetylglucosamine-1-phosphate transferase